jgi:hypothetical protein
MTQASSQEEVGAFRPRYRGLVHEVAETVAMPHTYTLLIWATTMVTVAHRGLPDLISIFCLLVGACAAYIAVGRIGHRIHDARPAVHRRAITHPYLVACGNLATLAAATGACAAVSLITVDHLAWLAVGITGTSVFLLGIALQAVVQPRIRRARAGRPAQ